MGLGLIGSSYAARLKAKGHTVYGFDVDQDTLEKAKVKGVVDDVDLERLLDADVLIMATYPQAMRVFLSSHSHLLNPKTLVTDVAGVKVSLMEDVLKVLPHPERYLSHHPMAGKAASGFDHHDATLFEGATCLMIEEPFQSAPLRDVLKSVLEDLGFARFETLSAAAHDEAIGYVSQLTHAIAGALMHMDEAKQYAHTAGDSFGDLTRIAALNASMWTQLFDENRTILAQQLTRFAHELLHLSSLIEAQKTDQTHDYLAHSAKVKAELKEGKK